MLRGDGLFQIIENINNNAYKIELPVKYGVGIIFIVFDLSLFDIGDDSKVNLFKETGNNAILALTPRDPLVVSLGPVIRLREKREAVNGLLQETWAEVDFLQDIWAKVNFERISKDEKQVLINLIHVQEDLIGEHPDITKILE